MQVARFHGARAAAVAAEDRWFGQQALGDGLGYRAGRNVVDRNGGDDAGFDILHQRLVAGENAGGRHVNVLDALVGNDLHDHVGHIVAIAQMVVKGHGHAVLEAGFFHGLLDGCQQLGVAGFQFVAGLDRTAGDGGPGSGIDAGVGAFERLYLTIALDEFGDFTAEDIFHALFPFPLSGCLLPGRVSMASRYGRTGRRRGRDVRRKFR